MFYSTSPSLFLFTNPKLQIHLTSTLLAKKIKEIKGLKENKKAQNINIYAFV